MNSTNTFLIFSHADIKQGGKEAEEEQRKPRWIEDVYAALNSDILFNFMEMSLVLVLGFTCSI